MFRCNNNLTVVEEKQINNTIPKIKNEGKNTFSQKTERFSNTNPNISEVKLIFQPQGFKRNMVQVILMKLQCPMML